MKIKISSIILGSLLLSGCAPSSVAPKVSSQEYITPSVGTTNTAYMGDPMVKSATGYKTELLKLGSASGALSDIKEGTYCHTGNNVYVNPIDKNSIGLKNLYGVVVNSVNYVTYDKAKNTISPPNGTTYNSSEISIQYVPNGLCMVSDSFVKTIEYNGKSHIVNSLIIWRDLHIQQTLLLTLLKEQKLSHIKVLKLELTRQIILL